MAEHSPSLSRQLAEKLKAIRYETLPDEVIHHAKMLLLDLFGVVLGAQGTPEADIMLDGFVQTHLDRENGSLLWGTHKFASMPDAALFNGTLAHVLELDDFGGADHSGAVVIPALMSVCKGERGISGRKFIEAMVIGYEASRRTLEAAGAYRGHNNAGGWHSTGTCGAVGAACAVAHILDLPIDKMVSAIGFSVTMAGGTWAFQQDGAMSKRLHSGWAAHLGTYSAQLARSGLTGPEFAFEAEWGGFLNTYAKESKDPDKLLEGFGDWWRILRSGIKPYPCCRDNHSTIDVMIDLHRRLDGDISQIESIDVGCIPEMVQMLNNRSPKTVLDAQLSLPFCSSVALLRGRVQLEDFELDQLENDEILAVKQKIYLSENKDLPFDSEPLITVAFTDGTAESFTVPFAKGAPQNPLTVDEVRAKFEMLTRKLLSAETQGALWQAIDQIEECDDVAVLEKFLTE
ncbi:MAG: MmgE/PrpD family protein [Anaerolineae bacterium]